MDSTGAASADEVVSGEGKPTSKHVSSAYLSVAELYMTDLW